MSDEVEGGTHADESAEDQLENQLLDALSRGDATRAAAIFRESDGLTKTVSQALADLFDGDPTNDESLVVIYRHRLMFAPWPVVGRPRRGIVDFYDDIALAKRVRHLVKSNKMTVSAASEIVGAKSKPKIGGSKVQKAYYRVKKRMLFWGKL
jgi:hypothetical protein